MTKPRRKTKSEHGSLFALVVLLTTALMSCAVHGDNTKALEHALNEPGRHQLTLTVAAPDQQTVVPITILVGERPGDTLLVLSGVHGAEHAPILASQQLANELDTANVSGKVIFVHIANMPAYLGRSIYTSPVDQKNLNRIFPGKADGTLSERIAHLLTNKLYPLADAVLDMHSGDGNEDLRPNWVGYYAKAGDRQVIKKSRGMALAFGFEHIVEFQWQLTDKASAIWAGSAAIALGIPSIDVEAGGKNIAEPETVAAIKSGVRRVMAHLGQVNRIFPPPAKPLLIRDRSWISAPLDGSWTALKSAGETVLKDEVLGYVTDWHGVKRFEARAPHNGLLLLTLSAPPVHSGETVAIVAKLPGE